MSGGGPQAAPALAALWRSPRGMRVAVVGLGVTGHAMALYLLRRGARVTGFDQAASAEQTRSLVAAGAAVVRGPWPAPLAASAASPWDVVALSPGISPRLPWLLALARQQVPVVGELAWRRGLLSAGRRSPAPTARAPPARCWRPCSAPRGCGRWPPATSAPPTCACVRPPARWDVAVVELSSYQLEAAGPISPEVGVVLNLSPDHASRYPDIAAYAAAKAQLVAAVPPAGRLVLNALDPLVVAMAQRARAPVSWLGGRPPSARPDDGAYGLAEAILRSGEIADSIGGGGGMGDGISRPAGDLDLKHPSLVGAHNRLNIAAAVLAAEQLAPLRSLAARRPALLAFSGLAHRLQPLGEVGGVHYVNDSKATNDAAAAAAVAAQKRPTWLLCGGQDKGGGYAELRAALAAAPLRGVVVFGPAAAGLEAALAGLGMPLLCVPSLPAACAEAAGRAVAGDVVLLAPACASFDAFSGYRARGEAFAAWLDRWRRQ